jgi:lysophospholipase L1-like esterase
VSKKQTAALVVASTVASLAATALVLRHQVIETRKRIGPRRGGAPFADGRYGDPLGIADRLIVLGDSGAVGLGAPDPEHTMGAVVARGWVAATNRPIRLATAAVVGGRTRDLTDQLERVRSLKPTHALIIVGANDVTHFDNPRRCARELGRIVRELVDSGADVVVGTCPDVGASPQAPRLLGSVGTAMATAMARAQTTEVRRAGGVPVPLAELLAPAFTLVSERMFGDDGFHPSGEGYMTAGLFLLQGLMDVHDLPMPTLAQIEAIPGPSGEGAAYRRAMTPHPLPPAPESN